MDLALNNLQRLICHKTNQTKHKHEKMSHHVVMIKSAELQPQKSVSLNFQTLEGYEPPSPLPSQL